MDCREAQSLIIPFIDEQIDNNTLKDFLEHINSCDDCYDELEVYYIVLSGTKQLDEDETIVSDFKSALQEIIQQKNEVLRKKRVKDFRVVLGIVSITLVILCVIAFMAILKLT